MKYRPIDQRMDPSELPSIINSDVAARRIGTVIDSYFYMRDLNGNVTGLIDGSGTVVERYAYSDYGNVTVFDGSWTAVAGNLSAFGNPLLFQAMMFDAPTGLYRTLNRFYSPENQTWITRDPIGYEGGANVYAFVSANPISRIDPNGTDDAATLARVKKLIEVRGYVNEVLRTTPLDEKRLRAGADLVRAAIEKRTTQLNDKFHGLPGDITDLVTNGTKNLRLASENAKKAWEAIKDGNDTLKINKAYEDFKQIDKQLEIVNKVSRSIALAGGKEARNDSNVQALLDTADAFDIINSTVGKGDTVGATKLLSVYQKFLKGAAELMQPIEDQAIQKNISAWAAGGQIPPNATVYLGTEWAISVLKEDGANEATKKVYDNLIKEWNAHEFDKK